MRAEPLPKPHTPYTMTPEETVAKFADALEQFKPIYGQPSDTDLTRIRGVVALIHLQIPYDDTGGTHNLIVLIWPVAAYTTCYDAEFPNPHALVPTIRQLMTMPRPVSARARNRRTKPSALTAAPTRPCFTPTLRQRRFSPTSKWGAQVARPSTSCCYIMICRAITLK